MLDVSLEVDVAGSHDPLAGALNLIGYLPGREPSPSQAAIASELASIAQAWADQLRDEGAGTLTGAAQLDHVQHAIVLGLHDRRQRATLPPPAPGPPPAGAGSWPGRVS